MSKKRIPFDIAKMNKDFSNVVYRDGTRPQFVCEATDFCWKITSVMQNGQTVGHKPNGRYCNESRNNKYDILLEVDHPYPPIEELSEDQKELMKAFAVWFTDNFHVTALEGEFSQGFDKVYTIFLNSQEK